MVQQKAVQLSAVQFDTEQGSAVQYFGPIVRGVISRIGWDSKLQVLHRVRLNIGQNMNQRNSGNILVNL